MNSPPGTARRRCARPPRSGPASSADSSRGRPLNSAGALLDERLELVGKHESGRSVAF